MYLGTKDYGGDEGKKKAQSALNNKPFLVLLDKNEVLSFPFRMESFLVLVKTYEQKECNPMRSRTYS